MKFKQFFFFVAALILLISCGQQHDAEIIVKQFIAENAVDASNINILEFNKLDSTKLINDSIIGVMQSKHDEMFKENIEYSVKQSGRILYIVRMRYTYNSDTISKTFYLDESLQNVVSFK